MSSNSGLLTSFRPLCGAVRVKVLLLESSLPSHEHVRGVAGEALRASSRAGDFTANHKTVRQFLELYPNSHTGPETWFDPSAVSEVC